MYAHSYQIKLDEIYKNAVSQGKKEQFIHWVKGRDTYVSCLENVLKNIPHHFEGGRPKKETIETCCIQGPARKDRRLAFSPSYLPLYKDNETDFATKWKNVYKGVCNWADHPIEVFEFMQNYYVKEGNKRTSVAKFINMSYMKAEVKRIIPDESNTDSLSLLYHEYLKFEQETGIKGICCSNLGDYERLYELISGSEDFLDTIYHPFLQNYSMLRRPKGNYRKGDILLDFMKEKPQFMTDKKMQKEIIRLIRSRIKGKNF
ncbi:MAG: hypothetical protein ACLFP2_01750 [Candidatus Woesearchaeota archaeon]